MNISVFVESSSTVIEIDELCLKIKDTAQIINGVLLEVT